MIVPKPEGEGMERVFDCVTGTLVHINLEHIISGIEQNFGN